MSVRKIKPYKNSDFIQKTIDIDRKISYIADLSDLAAHKDEFTKREYLSNARNRDEAISLIYEDLHIRNSNFKVYYVRSWKTKAIKKF